MLPPPLAIYIYNAPSSAEIPFEHANKLQRGAEQTEFQELIGIIKALVAARQLLASFVMFATTMTVAAVLEHSYMHPSSHRGLKPANIVG